MRPHRESTARAARRQRETLFLLMLLLLLIAWLETVLRASPRPVPPGEGESGRVTVHWDGVSGATGYRIYERACDGTIRGALDMGRERAVFSVFRRTSECPLYRIEKSPKLARRQGAYAVVTATGLILKRGNDLKRVLGVLDKALRVVDR